MLIHVNKVPLEVELADTPGLHKQGLMHRDSVEGGMLFKYPSEQHLSFWMKNTRVPLSIAFISKQGRINHISHMQPHDETPVTGYGMYALEVPKGWFEARDISRGHAVDLGMAKQAQQWDNIKEGVKSTVDNALETMGSSNLAYKGSLVAAGLGTSLLASLVIHNSLKNAMDNTARVTAAQQAGLKKDFHELKNMPVLRIKGFGNAAYIPPDSVNQLSSHVPAHMMNKAVKSGGMVIYDPDFAKPGIMAHEYGHADINKKGGLGKFNQQFLRPLGAIAATIGAPTAASYTAVKTDSPLLAAAAGLGVGALGLAPTLINEYSASARARDWVDSQKMKEPQKEANRIALSRALRTYWVPGAAGVTALGLLAGLISKRYDEGTVWPGLPKASV